MGEMVDLFTVNDYCKGLGLTTLHPLVSMADLSNGRYPSLTGTLSVRYHFYGVFLKQGQDCTIRYGRQNYDYQDGTLVFVGPGQTVDISSLNHDSPPTGYALLFHPDLLRGSHLGQIVDSYSFFSYDLSEALHISEKERGIVLDCFDKIKYELSQGIDKHSKALILSNIELFLNYCTRFYDRQFITRDTVNLSVIENFEASLKKYLKSSKARELGTPSVSYFADEQHLSPNYFGDLIKKETGKSAQEFIQVKMIEHAKEQVLNNDKSISEIAYDLGFRYPQHFTRLFKKKVGHSPYEYRMLN